MKAIPPSRLQNCVLPAALFILAACYFALGISIPLEWVDEGHIVYPSWRVSQGAIPYRDFGHLYGPSVFWLNGTLLRIFGDDLIVVRLFILASKAGCAVLVYTLAKRVASQTWALGVFAVTVVIWGLPWPMASTPYASYYGLTLSLAGVLAMACLPRRTVLACMIAGTCFGLATTFKQTTGAFAAMAAALFLLTERAAYSSQPGRGHLLLARTARWVVLLLAAGVLVVYMTPRGSALSSFVIFAPAWLMLAGLVVAESRGEIDHASQAQSLVQLMALGLGTAIPLLLCAGYFAAKGLLGQLWFNTVAGVPGHMNWYVPLPAPELLLPWVGLWLAAALAALPAGKPSPVRVAATLALAIIATITLVAQSNFDPDWWFWSVDELLHTLPLLATWTALFLLFRDKTQAPQFSLANNRDFRLLACYAISSLLFLHPSADIWHVLQCLPVFLPVLARELQLLASGSQWRTAIAVAGLALVLAPGAHDLLSNREADAKPAFERASGISGTGPVAKQAARLVRLLDTPQYRQGPIFITSGKQMIYFLAGRPSALEQYELGFYLLAIGVLNEAGFAAHLNQSAIIQQLQDVRPLIIEDSQGDASKQFRRSLPEVAAFVDRAYGSAEWVGRFGVRKPLAEGRSTTSK